jgi:hypothetical protein
MNLPPSSHDESSTREADERQLAQNFLSILQGHHQEIRRHPPLTATSELDDPGVDPRSLVLDGITVEERKILSRTSYQNWTAGSVAGAATLGLLMGLTWWASRTTHALPRRPPAAWRELDRLGASSLGGKTTKRQSRAAQELEEAGRKKLVVGEATEAMDPTALGGEVMSQGRENDMFFRVGVERSISPFRLVTLTPCSSYLTKCANSQTKQTTH